MVEKRPSIEVASSVMNYFDASVGYTGFWSTGKFVRTAQESGYTGLEWHPIRILAGQQLRRGFVDTAAKDGIRSLHQSWRSEKSLREAWRHPHRVLAVVSYLLLPETADSLQAIENIQTVVGRRLPAVLYPSQSAEETGVERSFKEKLFQPTSGIMQEWGVTTVSELVDEMYRRGYTGFCLDLYHFRKPGNTNLSMWQNSLPELLPHTKEIHVSAGRVDMDNDQIDTIAELRDLLHGTRETDLPRILEYIKELGWNGDVVTEVPALAVKQELGIQQRFMSSSNLSEGHRRIHETVMDALSR